MESLDQVLLVVYLADQCNKKNYKYVLSEIEKLEIIYKNDLRPSLFFIKGSALEGLFKHNDAIDAYKKAERDEGGYSPASNARGNILANLGRYVEAIEAYEKSELDGIDGKNDKASYNKGISLMKLGRVLEAIEAFSKAENDNVHGKYPDASYNKGQCYRSLKNYSMAIKCFTKAEQDSKDGKHPPATLYKGLAYSQMDNDNIELAEPFLKTALSGINNINHPDLFFAFVYSHFFLGKVYVLKKNLRLAKKHAYTALKYDDRNLDFVSFIHDNFSTHKSDFIYKNRVNLLILELAVIAERRTLDFNKAEQYNIFLKNVLLRESNDLTLFQVLLKIKSIQFPINIPYDERLRLAYLTHFIKNEFHHVFYIIDNYIDGQYPLTGIDYYFYLVSALQVGEATSELEGYYTTEITLNESDPFYKDFKEVRNIVLKALKNNSKHDPYLLKVEKQDFSPSEEVVQNINSHQWVSEALKTLINKKNNPFEEYSIPLTGATLKGLFTQLIDQDIDLADNKDTKHITGIDKAISTFTKERSESVYLISIARDAIKDNIPYTIILKKLSKKYLEEKNEVIKHNITIVQAAVLLSHQVDFLKKTVDENNYLEIPTASLLDMTVQQTLLSNLVLDVLDIVGVSTAIGLLTKLLMEKFNKISKEKINSIFDLLLNELK